MKNKDYYVYVHKRNDTSVVFYGGHGRTTRAFQDAANKTKDWKVINEEANGHTVEFLHEGLTKEQAVELEHKYISEPKLEWRLVNKRLPTKVISLDFNKLNEIFYYDDTSPTGLRYKKNIYKNKGAISKREGDTAGTVCYTSDSSHKPRGWRVKVTIDGVKQMIHNHRIVWLLKNGTIPDDLVVDHIDGNSLNNKIENLRLVSYKTNSRNRVNRFEAISIVRNNAVVSLSDGNGNTIRKCFSVNKYGKEMALAMAAYWKLWMLNCPEYSDYSERHVKADELRNYIDEVRLWQ